MTTTVGQLLTNKILPPELQDYHRELDGTALKQLLSEVAKRHPEKYRDISHRLADIGWRAAQETGGFSFGVQHLRKSKYATGLRQQLQTAVQKVLDDDSLDDKQREEAIIKLTGQRLKEQQDNVLSEAKANGNPLAMQVVSKARGNKMNLNSLLGSDLLYTDQRDNVIPVPVLSSYSEGLKPWEYWASAYGARKGIVDLKLQTANAGFFSKQLNQAAHRLVIEDLDSKDDPDTLRGLPVATDDADSEGALLAAPVGPYRRNTVLTPKILQHLRQLKHDRILVRSPAVGSATHGGVYARDVGVREHGVLPGRGEIPGLTAAQALSEPISQNQLSSKHTGGVAGEGKGISGFDFINQLVQVPKHFNGGAAHAEVDGTVSKIADAPAGGKHVVIGDQRHYVPAGATLKIDPGDSVEAGDTLSDGIPNPAKIVEHKGVGEGRRYFVQAFREAMASAGIPGHRRNIELIARGLINHVRLTDEMGDYVPDDVVPYSALEHSYQPRKDAVKLKPSLAKGKYLEKPVLHYTIGTKLRPSVLKDLEDFGVDQVTVHHQPPPFQPEMIRGMYNLAHDADWMTKMHGSGLKGSLLKSVHRGATSDEQGSSFVPSLAKTVDFGRTGGIVHKPEPGWQPEPPAAIKVSAAGVPNGVPGSGENFHMGDGKAPGITPLPAKSPALSGSTGGIAPLPVAGGSTPQPAPAAAPPTPEYRAAPYFSDYQASPDHTRNPLMTAAMQNSQKLGPLAPLAMLAGLDWNALGVLTRGGGDATAPSPTPAPAATKPPITGESILQPATPAVNPLAATAQTAAAPVKQFGRQDFNTPGSVSGWDVAKGMAKGYAKNFTEPISKDHPATDLWWRYNSGVDLARLGSWGARLPGVRNLPGAALAGQLGGKTGILSKASPGLKGQLAAQTLISTGQGMYDAFQAGGGNPIKGYDVTSEKMTQPAGEWNTDSNVQVYYDANGQKHLAGPSTSPGQTVDVAAGIQNATMDPITTGLAFGKTINRLDNADPTFQGDIESAPFRLLTGRIGESGSGRRAYENKFDSQSDRNIAAAQLGGTASFSHKVYQSGGQRLIDKQTGAAVPLNADEFYSQVPQEYQSQIASRLYHEMPEQFLQMFGDKQYTASLANGIQPPPDAVARQQALSRNWQSAFGR